MTSEKSHLAIIAIVERGKADAIVAAAQRAGASGATVLFARGTGTEEHLSLFRIQVDAMKEVIIILAGDSQAQAVLTAISEAGHLTEPGTGIAFAIPAAMVVGFEYLQRVEDKPH